VSAPEILQAHSAQEEYPIIRQQQNQRRGREGRQEILIWKKEIQGWSKGVGKWKTTEHPPEACGFSIKQLSTNS
jgi:hypothetical protein